MTDPDEDDRRAERRGAPDRRRYNRRTTGGEPSPPYFEVFERIAGALERIADALPRDAAPAEIRLTPRDASDLPRPTRSGSAGTTPRR